jgi:ankyrin repeat/BTB/POZ domain-containing protein 1
MVLDEQAAAAEEEEEEEEEELAWAVTRQRMVASSSSKGPRNLWQACMVGDLDRVRYLVEVEEVNVNAKDPMDALPVYFCCLCGHEDVLRYLLDHGARLDDGTFEAHRCYYAALTDSIKRVLREAKAKPNLGTMDVFAETLRRELCPTTFSRQEESSPDTARLLHEDNYADFVLRFPSASERAHVAVHRCVLAARCRYFDRLFGGSWAGRAGRLLPRCQGARGAALDAILE